MKKISFVSLLVLIALLATIGSAIASESRTVFRAPLSAASDTGSEAHGNAIFVFKDDGSQLTYKLVINGLDNTLMAHIHVASVPGGDGPPVLWLYPDAAPPSLIVGTFNGLLGSRTVTSDDLTGPLAGMSFDDLRAAIEQGRAYVNVHTSAFLGGEIRGTIQ